jgi:hypothetical protein
MTILRATDRPTAGSYVTCVLRNIDALYVRKLKSGYTDGPMLNYIALVWLGLLTCLHIKARRTDELFPWPYVISPLIFVKKCAFCVNLKMNVYITHYYMNL